MVLRPLLFNISFHKKLIGTEVELAMLVISSPRSPALIFHLLHFFSPALGSELRPSHLLCRHSYHFGHSNSPVMCWVFLR
jgi:hypothetical protein